MTLSVVISTLIAESLLRHYKPYSAFKRGFELSYIRDNPRGLSKQFTIDSNFGFRPILGNAFYNKYGTWINTYTIEKRQNVKRLLFIGDSVTSRGKIIIALTHLFGVENFEYWNAGGGVL